MQNGVCSYKAERGLQPCPDRPIAPYESRLAFFPETNGYVETAIYDRYAFAPGMQFNGPAIVEERESTLIVGARGRARVDDKLNVVVELSDGK